MVSAALGSQTPIASKGAGEYRKAALFRRYRGGREELFWLACERDLEGVVAKHKRHPYLPDAKPTWLKIRNQSYSQWAGREELFERERGSDPDREGWDGCVAACAAAEL